MSEFILRGITAEELCVYVARQLNQFFPDKHPVAPEQLHPVMGEALERTCACFTGIEKKKFRADGRVAFNYLHPDHYAMFIYLLSNTVSRRDRANPLAFRLFYLNKAMHGLDAYHDTELPEIFQFMHPLGTILGHAKYGNYFCVYQGCSVGSDEDGVYPEIGEHVILYAGASVIGHSKIGDNVVIGANAMILNRDIPANKVILAGYQRLNMRDNNKHVLARQFR